EDVAPNYSQSLRLALISESAGQIPGSENNPCKSNEQRRVLVLDHEPFLVAEVRYVPFDLVQRFGTSQIGYWSNAEGESAAWKLQFEEQPFCLVLPPQGVGEEMVKDSTTTDDNPLDFNFSPATRLALDPRIARTRFAEAPWNLRRIMGTRGNPTPGPLVK